MNHSTTTSNFAKQTKYTHHYILSPNLTNTQDLYLMHFQIIDIFDLVTLHSAVITKKFNSELSISIFRIFFFWTQ